MDNCSTNFGSRNGLIKTFHKNGLCKTLTSNPAKVELDTIVAAWYSAEGDVGIQKTILQRSNTMIKGFAGLPPQGLPSWKRTAALAGIYASSVYFMKEESKAEKYFVNE